MLAKFVFLPIFLTLSALGSPLFRRAIPDPIPGATAREYLAQRKPYELRSKAVLAFILLQSL